VFDLPVFDADGRVPDWFFGHLSYDLKDSLEDLRSRHVPDGSWPMSRWFVPRWVIEWREDRVMLHTFREDEAEGLALLEHLHSGPDPEVPEADAIWTERTPRARYLVNAATLLDHIHRGDIYEVNYCTTRDARLNDFDPFAAFGRLLHRSDAPYAAFYRMVDRFALCASPERFLCFDGDRVVGQPMKGTRPRSSDPSEDLRLAQELATDPKERSENIMALDVMRHDLSRVAAPSSVMVEELCGVHAFTHVHQMISTVAARLRDGVTPGQAVLAAFPMASMTGAPKIRAMQLIDAVEDAPRGLFSGSIGFFAPDGTADLNVVIRTLLYDRATSQATISTGSALTATCDPEQEWEECILKARTVIQALHHA
jgi:para-aminobenzoate synthetase component 1